MDEEVGAFQCFVHESNAYQLGKKICKAFKEHLGPKQFRVSIRAQVGKRVIAKEEIQPLRKDVAAKCYGGDYSRKKKLLDAQKAGKAEM